MSTEEFSKAMGVIAGKLAVHYAEARAKEVQIQVQSRAKIQVLLDKRQPLLDNTEGFWGAALRNEFPCGNEFPLLNATTDPKITRAITSLYVTCRTEGDKLFRKVVIKFRPNIIVESTQVSREIDEVGNTTAIEEIVWKSGTEKSRAKSLFCFFEKEPATENYSDQPAEGEEKAELKKEYLIRVLNELDALHQDPLPIDCGIECGDACNKN
jgi:hypothetical protein